MSKLRHHAAIKEYYSMRETEIGLRDVRDDDLPLFFEFQLDPEAQRMAAFPGRDRDGFMTHWAKARADSTVMLKAVIYDGRVAGSIVSWEVAGQRQIGYWLGKEYWGKG